MKWFYFAGALAATLPMSHWLRRNPRMLSKVWAVFGFLPFGFNLHISPIDWSQWPGYVFGLQITALDLLTLVILLSGSSGGRPLPFRWVMGFYFIAVLLSILPAQVPMAAVFYAWQIARVFFVFLVVTRASSNREGVPIAILTGMTLGLCYQASVAVWQRFGAGVFQAGGSFGDQNLLGFVAEFAVFPIFALYLAGNRKWAVPGLISGIIIILLTVSRAAVGLGAVGLALIFALSSLRRWTFRKASILLAAAALSVLLVPLVISSFETRFAADPFALEYDERAAFEKAASLILADHPFGIGANNYVVAANTGGYLTRANVPWGSSQREAVVHNVYWLAAAETGYFGAVALALLMFRVTFVAFRCGWKDRDDGRSNLLLGLGVSLLIAAIHNVYEWVFFIYDVQYLFAMTAGLTAGLSVQAGYWGTAKPNHTRFTSQQASILHGQL